jgi:hypothetical protein
MLAVVLGMCVLLEFRFRRAYSDLGSTIVIPLSPEAPVTSVVRHLRERGHDALNLLPPSVLYMQPDLPVLPLAGVTRRTTVLCRDAEHWLAYDSDEWGFNNPRGLQSSSPDDLLLGDDPAAGVCLLDEDTIAGRLRRGGASVVNLALPGDGPLAALGALREYGLSLRPRTTVWVFTESSATNALAGELRSDLLQRYLVAGFSQGLPTRTAEIDAVLVSRIEAQYRSAAGGPLPPVGSASTTSAVTWGHWFDFPALKRAYAESGVRRLAKASVPSAVTRGLGAAAPEVPASAPPMMVGGFLSAVFTRAKTDVETAGGRLVVIYLPERRRFEGDYADLERSQVLKILRGVGVTVVDLTPAFAATGHPLALFYKGWPQYGPEVSGLVIEAINRTSGR